MRALISLNHQSDTFVTPENLSERIDEAFITNKTEEFARTAVTVRELEAALKERRSAPKLSQWNYEPAASIRDAADGFLWSESRSRREMKVVEALYGVDLAQSPFGALPSLEVLEESKEVVERSLKEDLEAARLEDRSYTEPIEKV
ncbi:hypothetical protein BDN72DRAFT_831576 [Pluteus cervinus]|uniref:Uncharacterized protein n=1 Tax=Pluteus cervinus TaxID=181527 RepID=A0ACD3BDX0_9AGAR|nr:hypothetical protein BDN72DRAFT_831576 [Pluteus cervinus]